VSLELRFHKELYDGFAVDEAAKTYADFAKAELREEEHGWVIVLTAIEGGEAVETVAAELANFALGKTIERRGEGAAP
jgi:hypothetical protein